MAGLSPIGSARPLPARPAPGAAPSAGRGLATTARPKFTAPPAPQAPGGGQSPQQLAIMQMLQSLLGGGSMPGMPGDLHAPGTVTQRHQGSQPWESYPHYDAGSEAKQSSGDAYSNLTSDPFAKGPDGLLNIQG